ncbi:MAG: SAM-dependent methyltransferase [Candidatus Delongbacteria bacterium]|jgi:hypothetical protein|nr:SAM-dependent methyltransferase [Candidatus Delongbacteria bacterium]
MNELSNFTKELKLSLESNSLIRLILSSPDNKTGNLNKITVRTIEIKNKSALSFLFTYKNKTITKNLNIEESISFIAELFGKSFTDCVLFTTENDFSFRRTKKGKILFKKLKPAHAGCDFSMEHNFKKTKIIKVENNIYLERLAVVKNGRVSDGMSGKFKQINRFIETIGELIEGSELIKQDSMNIVDMGSGKGYLTFAVYDFLINELKKNVSVTGIELREDLVEKCTKIAFECSFENLKFVQGSIESQTVSNCDILIALHACDTATDDAIYKGITSDSEIIVVSPCCHKQIRKQLHITGELKEITKHGILEERMAEMVTDTMRGLILEAYGYKTKIFEYISDEHTHKNLMISAVKTTNKIDKDEILKRLTALKKTFGIEKFYLEELMKSNL